MNRVVSPREKSQAVGSSEPPLGTTYEIVSPPLKSLEKSDGIFRRLERYRLQSVARSFLPDQRVGLCLRRVIPHQNVKVYRSEKRASYGGLITCGSVWLCPCCAGKIAEGRRLELLQGMENWKGSGNSVLMATHTVPHYAFQPLKLVLGAYGRARHLMRKRKPFLRLRGAIRLRGTIRSLEVTWGENGWHVHDHELLFVEGKLVESVGALEKSLLGMWQSACESVGLERPNDRGLRVADGSQAGDYASKWGMESEMTKSHTKEGRDRLTPWDFLRRGEGDLFREYAKAFKGKRQLVWSEGLRGLLGVGPGKTDEELSGSVDEGAEVLGYLSRDQWAVVLRSDRRAELLQVAEREGWPGVVEYVVGLVRAGFGEAPF